MLTETLQTLFNRDLNKLKAEISLYQDEKKQAAVSQQAGCRIYAS